VVQALATFIIVRLLTLGRALALCALWAALALAVSAAQVYAAPPAPTPFTIEGPNVILKGVRYANPGKPPIVLFHGLVENSRIWRELGYALHEMGYDVWMPNFRGHGRGSQRSVVKRYRRGLYGFKYMVTEDVPLVLDHVRAVTGQQPVADGHSMGGMAIKEYASGVYLDSSGKLARSEERAREIADSEISKLVIEGSPPHFRDVPLWSDAVSRVTKPITSRVQGTIPAPGLERAPTDADPQGMLAWLRDKALSAVDPIMPALIPKSLVNGENLSRAELKALREKSLSQPHTDIFDDFGYWVKSKRFVSRDGFDYEADRKIFVPTLYVAGDLDTLAPAHLMTDEMGRLPAEAQPRVAVVANTGHVDLVAGERSAVLVAPVIHDWIEDPSRLGPPGFELAVGKECVRPGLRRLLWFRLPAENP
jgi:pimeloyl-ACP methyl ester carboxylesterase